MHDITERARSQREKRISALQDAARCLRFLLIHGALCMVIALTFGFIAMQVHMATHSVNEFVGLYLVFAVFFVGPVACGLALPVYLWAYFKAEDAKHHRYAAAASFTANVVVGLFFYILSARDD